MTNIKLIDTENLKQLVLAEFAEIITDVTASPNELRINLRDGSFVDVWFSINLVNRYSYHWERKHIDGSIYRHDNTPHLTWKNIETFPKHFHNRSEKNVEPSYISDFPENAIKEMMAFVREKIQSL
jgi:hypothetical protein